MSVIGKKNKNENDVKTNLNRLVAGNQLELAVKRLLDAAAVPELDEYRARVVQQWDKLKEYQRLQIVNTDDYGTIAQTRNNISLSLLELIDELPDAIAITTNKKELLGIAEQDLRKRLFLGYFISKIIVILYAYFLLDTGSGLSSNDFLTITGILIPISGSYLAIILQNSMKSRRFMKPEDIRVNTGFTRKAYLAIGSYPVILCLLLYLRAIGTINPSVLILALCLLESGFGAYVGNVVISFIGSREQ